MSMRLVYRVKLNLMIGLITNRILGVIIVYYQILYSMFNLFDYKNNINYIQSNTKINYISTLLI